MTTQTWLTQGYGLVEKDEMCRFMQECFEAAGTSCEQARLLADVLITADYRGHYSDGLNRLEEYVKQILIGHCNLEASPRVLQQSTSTAFVDGCNALGPEVGNFCMRIAIEKAKETGVGWVSARGSNDFGKPSYYTMQALEEGLIGFACSNSPAVMPPGDSTGPFLGCNPLSFAAPAQYKDGIILDMSCSIASLRKVELMRRTQQRLPLGWALDEADLPTTDPFTAARVPKLLPLGSLHGDTAYKGFGLAFMVDALTGVLAGGCSGPRMLDWRSGSEESVRFSQSFLAIDPKRFAPNFEERLFNMIYRLRGMDRVDLNKKIFVPGDPEREHMKKVKRDDGILYHSNQLKNGLALAQFLEVEPFKIK